MQQVLAKVAERTTVTTCVGDKDTPGGAANILVTVPGWIANQVGGRKKIDLSSLKLIIYDEADEIFF